MTIRSIGRAVSAIVLLGGGIAVGHALTRPPASERRLLELVTAGEQAPREVGLREWIAAQPEPALPRGEQTVRGTVQFEDGRPASGVAVWVQYAVDDAFALFDVYDPYDAEQVLRVLLRKYSMASRPVAEATTDASGAFELDGISAEMGYCVSGRLEGFAIVDEEGAASPGAPHALIAKKLCRVDVDVRLPDGRQPSHAKLTLTLADIGRTYSIPWEGSNKALWLSLGAYELSAGVWRSGVHLYDSPRTRFEVNRGDAPRSLRVVLHAAVD